MLLYTYGDEYSYIRAELNTMGGDIFKSPPDGVVFQTLDDAKIFIKKYGDIQNPTVFGVVGDWERDTVVSHVYPERWIHHPAKPLKIVFLSNSAKKIRDLKASVRKLNSRNYDISEIARLMNLYPETIEFILEESR